MNRQKVIFEHVRHCIEEDSKAVEKANNLYKELKEAITESDITDKKKEKLLIEFNDFMCAYMDMAYEREQAIKRRWETYNNYIEAVKEIQKIKKT